MKICIYGAGAIGGYLAVELALSAQDVCLVARGAHLEAIQKRGLTLRICALKAHQAFECAESFAPLLKSDTAVVTAMNGIPWWYFYKTGGPFEARWLSVASHREVAPIADCGGIRRAHSGQYPLEHLAQALGQCLLQSNQRADRCHPWPYDRQSGLKGTVQDHDAP